MWLSELNGDKDMTNNQNEQLVNIEIHNEQSVVHDDVTAATAAARGASAPPPGLPEPVRNINNNFQDNSVWNPHNVEE